MYWQKPTKQTFELSIQSLKQELVDRGITKLAIPQIGAGLDRLNWHDNREVIQRIFADTDKSCSEKSIILFKRREEIMVENNIVVFEDVNLAKLVAIEICGQPDLEVLTKEKLAAVESIFSTVSFAKRPEEDKIRSLKGLEHCTNLKQLHLIDHNISDLSPLEHLDHLEVVVLRSNRIQSIEVFNGKETIKTLVVGQNEIEDISVVQTLTGLKQLFVQENPLKHDSLLFINELPALREFCFWETNKAYMAEIGGFRNDILLLHNKAA